MDPQQPAVPSQNPPPTIVYVTQPTGHVYPKDLPLKSFHLVAGIIQMVAGMLMFILEVAALCSVVPIATGAGIYCGVLIFVAGLLSTLGARLESRPLIIASMILSIIAAVGCFTGLSWASFEVTWTRVNYMLPSYSSQFSTYFNWQEIQFGYAKSIIMVICCFFELILTIVHASLACRSVCLCCMPNANSANGATPNPAASGQQGVAYQTTFPAQRPANMQQAAMPQGTGFVVQQQPPAYVERQQPQGSTAAAAHDESSQFKYVRLSE